MSRLTLKKSLRSFEAVLYWISAIGLAVIMGLLIIDVILRPIGVTGLPDSIVITEVGMVIIGVLGIAYGMKRDEHVSSDILVRLLPPKWREVARLAWLIPSIPLITWMGYWGTTRGFRSFESRETHWGADWLPLWPARILVGVALLFLAVEMMLQIPERFRSGLESESEEME